MELFKNPVPVSRALVTSGWPDRRPYAVGLAEDPAGR
jgi:hypothetical protein